MKRISISKSGRTSPAVPKTGRLRRIIFPAVALILFIAAIRIFHAELRQYSLADIRAALHQIPTGRILLAVFFTGLSYLSLGGYELLAFAYAEKRLAPIKILLTSFLGYVFANNTGSWSVIASSSVRYRLYGGWGFTVEETTRIIGFNMVSFWLGFLALGGIAFVARPFPLPAAVHIPAGLSIRALGMVCLAVVSVYFILCFIRKTPLPLGRWLIPIPTPLLAAGQIVIAVIDLLCAGMVLYAVLPAGPGLTFPIFMEFYLFALLAGLLSNVPGGLGVIEAVMLLLLSAFLPGPRIVSALIVYRIMYYLVPLAAACVLLAAIEAYRARARAARLASDVSRIASAVIPQVLALATFASGALLLFTGSLPAGEVRLPWLHELVPLPVRELSHFLGSIVGMGLLVLADGLRHRLDGAYFFSVILLAAGIISSVFEGADYKSGLWLALLLAALFASRRQFRRRASILAEPLSAGWLTSILLVMLGSIWLGLFIYRHQSYSNDLWWRFALDADAPRFLRATVGAAAVVLFFALARLFRPFQPAPVLPGVEELEQAGAIAGQAENTIGYLALLGDKSLLFSDTKKAFLMYAVRGRSWIAMGEPVGAETEADELLWQFTSLCDHYGGWPVFYEVGPNKLEMFIDLGLSALKIGETGRVELADFSLAGGRRKEFRNTRNRLVRDGYGFEVIPREGILPLLPEFKAISDTWLDSKNTREKGFSLGFFNERYLVRFPAAVVRREGKIKAFANIWPGGGLGELSIDIMRYLPDAPHGLMDFLFVELILWGQGQGYQWFNLGMAPLAGLDRQQLYSLWGGIGAFVYRHGEHFYNFRGLREYKEKFEPIWEPRYLITPGGFSLPRVFTSLSSLIAGGLKGVVAK